MNTHDMPFDPTIEQSDVLESDARIIVVMAGAGTGKTTLLTMLIKQILKQMEQLENEDRGILMLSFSRQAVQEVRQKLGDDKRVEIRTIHSFGRKQIREDYKKLGYQHEPDFLEQKAEENDVCGMFDKAFAKIGLKADSRKILRKLLLRSIVHDVDMRAYLKGRYHELLPYCKLLDDIKGKYQKQKRKAAKLTFSDQLYDCRNLLKDKAVLKKMSGRYHTLLVDEFQDLSRVQLDIVYALAHVIEQVVVVGDDAQTIYSFRGARSESLREFLQAFPEAREFKLTESHRCTRQILEVANGIRAKIDGVTQAKLTSKREGLRPGYVRCLSASRQDWFVRNLVNELVEKRDLDYSDISILARSNRSLTNIYRYLKRKKIPVLLGNKVMLEKVCSCLKLFLQVAKQRDKESVIRLVAELGIEFNADYVDSITSLRKQGNSKEVHYLIQRLKLAGKATYFEEKIGYARECLNYYLEDAYGKVLGAYISEIKARTRKLNQLDDVVDAIGRFNNSHKRNCIQLHTIHFSKGMENEAVIIVDMADGSFPDYRAMGNSIAINDERKLLYVAVTRAKNYLCLVSSPYVDYDFYRKKTKAINRECSLLEERLIGKCREREYRKL